MLTFKDLYPNYEKFQTYIIDKIQTDYPNADWCDYEKMLVSWEAIYNYMYRQFNYRGLRYKSSKINDLLINTFVEYLSGFHMKQFVYLENNFKNLFDINNLGEMQTINNIVKSTQTQKQILQNLSQTTISPHAFTDALTDMSVSDITKNVGESDNTSNLDSQNDSQGTTKRVQILDKLIQLSDTKFRLYLKELISNFDNYFVRFQYEYQGDQDIFLKLLNILKNSKNINVNIDDKQFTINFDIIGIEKPLIDILDEKYDNTNLKNAVSKEPQNALKINEKDNLLYVSPGQGKTYFADEKTIHLDDSNNRFSAIGIEFDSSPTQKAVFDKYMVKQALSRITVNQQNIDKINTQLDADELNINKNIESIRQVVNIVNNKCVQKDKLNDIVTKDKPDNILQVLNNKEFYVPKIVIPPIPPQKKWKLFATGKDFKWVQDKNKWIYETKNFKMGDILFFQYWENLIPNFDISFTLFINTIINNHSVTYLDDFNNIQRFVFRTNAGYSISFEPPFQVNDFNINKVFVWILEDGFEIAPIPPTPTISKNDTYNFYKKAFIK